MRGLAVKETIIYLRKVKTIGLRKGTFPMAIYFHPKNNSNLTTDPRNSWLSRSRLPWPLLAAMSGPIYLKGPSDLGGPDIWIGQCFAIITNWVAIWIFLHCWSKETYHLLICSKGWQIILSNWLVIWETSTGQFKYILSSKKKLLKTAFNRAILMKQLLDRADCSDKQSAVRVYLLLHPRPSASALIKCLLSSY